MSLIAIDPIEPSKATVTALPAERSTRVRVESVDIVRGIVMVVMVLDHVRGFFSNAGFSPTDVTQTSVPLFFTRWVTHFCAPVFVFLAGTGAYLSAARGKPKRELARFLFTRGLWLIFLDLTAVHAVLFFDLKYHFIEILVLTAIGVSMITLAGVVFLSLRSIVIFGLVLVFGHNALDGIQADQCGSLRWLWLMFHQRGIFTLTAGTQIETYYPWIPWVGVMALGYAFGAVLQQPPAQRRTACRRLGIGLTIGFIVLRSLNGYGDPNPWSTQTSKMFTLLSFLNCTKYPPSLLYLLMTLGPTIIALALCDQGVNRWNQPLITLGRVALFYYVVQFFLIHILALLIAIVRHDPVSWLFADPPHQRPLGDGFELPFVYVMWLITLLLLYPLCRWYDKLKHQRRDLWWLSYL